jgi:CBS domain-containing protein
MMRHRLVGELMTSAVVQVRPDTSFTEVAELLAIHDTTSVPVADEAGRLVDVRVENGVVSVSDRLGYRVGDVLAPS